ncbi:MAG: serine protease [Acidobacteria bacterium]|nr:serine protease [Acidobacteriota bacterium]
MRSIIIIATATLFFAAAGHGQQVEPVFHAEPSGVFHPVPARRVSAQALTTIELDAPAQRVSGENVAGMVRALPRSVHVASSAGEQLFRSHGASRVRLHLQDVSLRDDAVLAVFGADGEAFAFGRELLGPDGDVWTPSVAGDTIVLQWPERVTFSADALGHIGIAPNAAACLRSAACESFADRATLSAATGQMTYVKGSSLYICTGGLINDGSDNPNRNFLTANHCISTAAEAASVDIAWDLVSSSCAAGDFQSRTKRTHGAALLVTSATSDVTLLRLNAIPADRWFMGWSTYPLLTGTVLRRISHPGTDDGGVYTQTYSSTTVDTTTSVCSGSPRPSFIYSQPLSGATAGGSSGAPVIIDGGYIVGQLLGACGPDPSDSCASTTKSVDGALASSFGLLSPYINLLPATPTCSACAPNSTTACLLGNRFKVVMTWHDGGANLSGNGNIIHYAENTAEVNAQYGPMSENAFFSMYSFAPKSVEAMVRMFRGVTINDKFWVFVTGFTGADYSVTVTDTNTCRTWVKSIPAGSTTVTKDFAAFAFP